MPESRTFVCLLQRLRALLLIALLLASTRAPGARLGDPGKWERSESASHLLW